jgi:hypothetical protein
MVRIGARDATGAPRGGPVSDMAPDAAQSSMTNYQ